MKLRFLLSCGLIATTLSFTACKSKPKDADLKTAIEQKISALQLNDVTVNVSEGVATITGTYPSEDVKKSVDEQVKGIKGIKDVVDNATVAAAPAAQAPVVINADDALIKGATEVIKQFAGVKADVKEGVISLSGEIKKTELPKLMAALMALHPKKVENKLTVK
ncbi:MAG TPA: BON domain-containing protein [Chitinophaga sp.]|uniref:BON domain-containing protein n=1 Tax=Chitinophaga sp. TaxID=1869181 RepID=UPI002BBA490A|nr:BON domain-containing protein [Chitinophaga sp.]HVI46778.1 BON domain-containing protein [Chitinophaga sp.]